MSIIVKPGTRLYSAVDATEMIAVKAPGTEVDITIGGVAPVTVASERTVAGSLPGHDTGAALGKRYVDAAGQIELLCTKPGTGTPAIDGVTLRIKDATALPASD